MVFEFDEICEEIGIERYLILIFNQNKTFATVFFASSFVIRLGNTYSIPGAAFLA